MSDDEIFHWDRPARTKPCSTGKIRHLSRDDAIVAIAKVASRGHKGLNPYLCPHCRWWHIGHGPAVAAWEQNQ